MRVTFTIGLAPAASVQRPAKPGRIVPPPPVDLLEPQHGVGVVPFNRDAVRFHRGQRVTSPSFRAALVSNLARWQHPGVTFDVPSARYIGPMRVMFVRDQKGRARSGSALGISFRVLTGRRLALQVGLAVNA